MPRLIGKRSENRRMVDDAEVYYLIVIIACIRNLDAQHHAPRPIPRRFDDQVVAVNTYREIRSSTARRHIEKQLRSFIVRRRKPPDERARRETAGPSIQLAVRKDSEDGGASTRRSSNQPLSPAARVSGIRRGLAVRLEMIKLVEFVCVIFVCSKVCAILDRVSVRVGSREPNRLRCFFPRQLLIVHGGENRCLILDLDDKRLRGCRPAVGNAGVDNKAAHEAAQRIDSKRASLNGEHGRSKHVRRTGYVEEQRRIGVIDSRNRSELRAAGDCSAQVLVKIGPQHPCLRRILHRHQNVVVNHAVLPLRALKILLLPAFEVVTEACAGKEEIVGLIKRVSLILPVQGGAERQRISVRIAARKRDCSCILAPVHDLVRDKR